MIPHFKKLFEVANLVARESGNYPELSSIRLREGECPIFSFDSGLMLIKVKMDCNENPQEAE